MSDLVVAERQDEQILMLSTTGFTVADLKDVIKGSGTMTVKCVERRADRYVKK